MGGVGGGGSAKVSGETGRNSLANPKTTDLQSLSFGPYTGDLSPCRGVDRPGNVKPGVLYPTDLLLLSHTDTIARSLTYTHPNSKNKQTNPNTHAGPA